MTPAAILAKAIRKATCNRVELAELADVKVCDVRHAERGAKGHATNANDYLKLCQVLGVDPVTGAAVPPRIPPGELDRTFFAMGVRATRRYGRNENIRVAAEEMEISVSVLSRIENGKVRGIDGMLAACRYIGIHPMHYVGPPCSTVNTPGNRLKNNDIDRSAA